VANTAYVGVPGSGKTYEVVTEVILVALKTGRRVVSNIAGLHYDEMRAYLMVDAGIPEEAIGALVCVGNEDIAAANFFYTDGAADTVVKPGDLVVIDECWRWFGVGQQISPAAFSFLREHRHFIDANGVSCDVVLISQSMQDLDRKVRVVVEKHFRMEKLKRLGLSKQYTVDVFNGYRMSNNAAMRRFIRKYNPKFYPFYSSYEGKGGDEREVDKRINVLRNPWFIGAMLIAPLMLIGGIYGTYRLWFGKAHVVEAHPGPARPGIPGGSVPDGSGGVGAVGSAAVAAGGGSVERAPSPWRVAGYYVAGDAIVFVLASGGHSRLVYAPPSYRLSLNTELFIDEKLATSYGGGSPVAGGMLGAGR
jgi:zona occludens toxin